MATNKRGRKVVDALTSTMRIQPDAHSFAVSHNRVVSLGYALAGWLYMLRWQKNTRLQAVASIAVLALALWLQVGRLELALLVLTITIVWMAEFINAAVEAVVNLASPDYHDMAKVAKDVAAAAVLLGVVASVIIGLLLLLPPLIEKFSG
ncbi:MAG TPA: diacylglycerol kinase family protein [Aggregatilineales bacterium]|jgi:diacylglycerol kinase|nr:diacylglycerol kinase family protein [Aggregatilineales bacterium]